MVGPLLLIVVGVLFLLNNLYPGVYEFRKMWPVILIVIGLAKVFEYIQGQAMRPADPPAKEPHDEFEDRRERQ